MRKPILTLLLLLVAMTMTAVTGSAPETGKTYYLYNVGHKAYLGSDDQGQLSLTGTRITVTLTEDSNTSESLGYYKLNDGKISCSSFAVPRSDGQGRYDQWKFTPVSDKENVYYLSARNRELNTNLYLYFSTLFQTLATEPFKPWTDMTYAQWMLVDPKNAYDKSITFDEADKTCSVPTDGAYYDVTLKRKLSQNNWNSFVVPFAILQADLKTQFGDNVQVAEFVSIDDHEFHFVLTTSVEAGKPCILRPTSVNENNTYTFSGISTFVSEPEDVTASDGGTTVTYQGSYTPYEVPARAYAFGGDQYMYHLQKAQPMQGFRAYFTASDTSGDSKEYSWTLDGQTTSIALPTTDEADGPAYNLQGQRVDNQHQLPRGIYIIGGRKVIK